MTVIKRRIGSAVIFNGEKMKIAANPSFDKVILVNKSNAFFTVDLDDILEAQAKSAPTKVFVDPIRAAKVPAYIAALGPVLSRSGRTRKKVEAAGKEIGISVSAAYASIKRFEESGNTQDLPPTTKPGGRDKMRIAAAAQKIIIEEQQKVVQGITKTRNGFLKAVRKRLKIAGVVVADNTLRAAYKRIDGYQIAKARRGRSDAERELDPKSGQMPEVRAPFELLQIDHWKIDVEILDSTRLHTIGRCWLTVAIDIYTRMIWGWHVGLDAPGTVPLGLCMLNGLTSKKPYLKKLGLDYSMPMSGKPDELRADNAKEFDGKTIKSGCDASNIILSWRPVKKPQYGQYIERYNGTLATALKEVPGATGSNPRERKELKPDKTAAFTLDDLRKHICMVINAYHNDVHGTLGVTPLEKYTSYYFNSDGSPKRAPPAVFVDTFDLRLTWYPLRFNSVRQTGLRVDYLDYYDRGIKALVRKRKTLKGKKVEVRQDPFDIRHVFLFHPTFRTWNEVRCSDSRAPEASLYQLKAARQAARKAKLAPTPENLFKLILEMDEHIESAKKATKSSRRSAARKKEHKSIRADAPRPRPSASVEIAPESTEQSSSEATAARSDTPPDLSSILSQITSEEIDECS